MKSIKKITAILLSVLLVAASFAGCSKAEKGETDEITKDTMLVAYTEECEPFIYTGEDGKLTGYDVELFEKVFDVIKGDYKNYEFIKVDKDYELGKDVCYTDKDGTAYESIIMIGGLQKNVATANEDYIWSENIIENKIVTVTSKDSKITSYNNIAGANVGVVSSVAENALSENSAIKSSLKSAESYADAKSAFDALQNGKIDAVVIDDFDLYNYDNNSSFTILDGTLDVIDYGFGFTGLNDISQSFNEAVKEAKSADYGDGDEVTPITEKYFGYAGACVFTYDSQTK